METKDITMTAAKPRRANAKREERFRRELEGGCRVAINEKMAHSNYQLLISLCWKRIHAECSLGEIDRLHAFSSGLFAAMQAMMVWRLGTATDIGMEGVGFTEFRDAYGCVPTHGGFFWPGTDRPWNEWQAV